MSTQRDRIVWVLGLAVIMSLLATKGASALDTTASAENIFDRIVYHQQGWGEMGVNTCAHAPGKEGVPLRIKDTPFAAGIGAHAPGETLIELDGQYKSFEAEVGVQWQEQNLGSVVFQVFVDGEKRFDSGVMRETDAAKAVRVSVEDAYELRLVMTDAGDGIICDCADWAEARLAPNPNAAAPKEDRRADMAPISRVVTSDPARTEGAQADRVHPFQAEDLFLTSEVMPGPDGACTVPATGCIGLEWPERRFLRAVEVRFAEGSPLPAREGTRIEFWHGESIWQGGWQPAKASIEEENGAWRARLSMKDNPELRGGTERIRWIFPPASGEVRVAKLSAYTASMWKATALRFEFEPAGADGTYTVTGYNGAFETEAGGTSALQVERRMSDSAPIAVRYCAPGMWKTDRTVLRFQLPHAAFGVAVEDILDNDGVYVPSAGFFAVAADSPTTLAAYKARYAQDRTVLDRVREMPDQTLAQAMEKVHNPIQDLGPMMLSLATDNRKFVADRDGSVRFEAYDSVDAEPIQIPKTYRLQPGFGAGSVQEFTRHLDGDWRPAPVTLASEDGTEYAQKTFVVPAEAAPLPDSNGWLYGRAVCIADYTLTRAQCVGDGPAELHLVFADDSGKGPALAVREASGGYAVYAGDRLLAWIDTRPAAPLEVSVNGTGIVLKGVLAAATSAACQVYLPAWPATSDDCAALADAGGLSERFAAYWNALLAPAMQVTTPDPLLNNVFRASQVHCLLAARNEAEGRRVAAWISSDRYGPLESEAHSVIRGMDMAGQSEYARRSLDFFIHRYAPTGYLTTGYTLMGTGWHLWTLAEHVDRSGDMDWFKTVAPQVAQAAKWIAAQRAMTQRLDARGNKVPEYGLVPPGVAADWNRFAYRYYAEGHYCAGLEGAAHVLAEAGDPDAPALEKDAAAFHADLLRAYRWTQSQSPVLELDDGTWVPAYPGMLYCFGRIEDIIPGEDANRSWCYDVELGAHHLAALGILAPDAPETAWIMNHMEDFWFLHSGMGDYPEARNKADWFDLGGFAKVQPYYARNAEVCALRDDVKPFIRSYFNTIPTLLSREILSFWEHFHNTGGWNKTHETGYFLAQTHLMLEMDRGNELWLAPLVPAAWLEDGKTLDVRQAPTNFGPVSYEVRSHAAFGTIEAHIEPPARRIPDAIVLRLRHPEGKTMQRAEVTGAKEYTLDAALDCIRIVPAGGPIEVKAEY